MFDAQRQKLSSLPTPDLTRLLLVGGDKVETETIFSHLITSDRKPTRQSLLLNLSAWMNSLRPNRFEEFTIGSSVKPKAINAKLLITADKVIGADYSDGRLRFLHKARIDIIKHGPEVPNIKDVLVSTVSALFDHLGIENEVRYLTDRPFTI
jgi:hypothetical protein